jgi:hypothetical protein
MRTTGGFARLLVHFGMLLATLAFASWWTSRTILDPSRTRRVTTTVLEDADLRHYVAHEIAPVVASAVGPQKLSTATGGTQAANAAAEQRLSAVLDNPGIRTRLETFIVDAHERLIGLRAQPAVLDKGTVDQIVHAALPTLSAAELAKIPPVKVDVPQVAALNHSRNALHHRFWPFTLGALILLGAALAFGQDRRSTVKLIGRWLIGISVVHLVVLWIVPVMIVPRVTTNPWASLVAAVARALNAGLVTGLVVLAVAGVVCMFVDLFIPATSASASGVQPLRADL